MKASFFYNHKLGDVLFIVIDNCLLSTRFERYDDIVIIYHNDKVIGINIFNISNVCKIKISGQIHLPPIVLVEMLNSLLRKFDIELDIVNESLFCIGKVVGIDNDFIKVDIGRIICIENRRSVNLGDYCVIAKKGALLSGGEVVNGDGCVCSYCDLSLLDNDEIIILDGNDVDIGQDFFLKRG